LALPPNPALSVPAFGEILIACFAVVCLAAVGVVLERLVNIRAGRKSDPTGSDHCRRLNWSTTGLTGLVCPPCFVAWPKSCGLLFANQKREWSRLCQAAGFSDAAESCLVCSSLWRNTDSLF